MAAHKTFELLLQMVISVNQLSIYGEAADNFEQLPVGQRAVGEPKAPGQLDIVEILTQLLSRFEINRHWTILLCTSVTKGRRKSIFMPRIYDASRSRRNSYQRVDPKQCTIWLRLGHKSLQSQRKIHY